MKIIQIFILLLFLQTSIRAQTVSNANFKISDYKGVRVHTYVNADAVMISTHILELQDSLVIIDAQLMKPDAEAVTAYVKSLNKPVARIIITHGHADHYISSLIFKAYPIYAFPEVTAAIQEQGEATRQMLLGNFGEAMVIESILVPQHKLQEGKMKVNGVTFVVQKTKNNEADIQTLITVPKAKLLIAGDFLYNKVHLFVGFNHLQDWKNQLENFRTKAKYVLPGHGYSTTKGVITENINYLNKALQTIAQPGMDAATYKTKMIEAFPDYGAVVLIDFGTGALFSKN